jgi:hypothetical protein
MIAECFRPVLIGYCAMRYICDAALAPDNYQECASPISRLGGSSRGADNEYSYLPFNFDAQVIFETKARSSVIDTFCSVTYLELTARL